MSKSKDRLALASLSDGMVSRYPEQELAWRARGIAAAAYRDGRQPFAAISLFREIASGAPDENQALEAFAVLRLIG